MNFRQDIIAINNNLSSDLSADVQHLLWNYSCHKKPTPSVFRKVIKNESYRQRLELKPCFSKEDLDIVRTKYLLSCYSPVSGLTVDESNYARYVEVNPRCVPFEKWERYNYIIFDRIGLTLEVEESLKCQFAIDVAVGDIEESVVDYIKRSFTLKVTPENCGLDLNLRSIVKASCNIGVEITIEQLMCESILDIIAKEYPGCAIDLNVVLLAIKCGLDLPAIRAIYSSGCNLELNSTGTELELCTGSGRYQLSSFRATETN